MAYSTHNKKKTVLDLIHRQGILRVKDLRACNINPEYLRRLLKAGEIDRISRGMYSLPDTDISEHHSLAVVSKLAPEAVVCLLSALSFHDIGTQSPSEIWIALPPGKHAPNLKSPRLHVVHFSRTTLKEGIEEHTIDRVPVKLTDPAKTVADCFKFRKKIGTDVAVESLRECLQTRKCTPDKILVYARLCRVAGVIRPYMEAVL